MKHDLEQQIAQLITQRCRIFALDESAVASPLASTTISRESGTAAVPMTGMKLPVIDINMPTRRAE